MRLLNRTAFTLTSFFISIYLVLALAVLAGCGGGSSSNAASPARPQFNAIVSFGDSLSDVGSYVAANVDPQTGAATGGHFTTNPGAIWVEDVSATFGLTISPNIAGFGATQVQCATTPFGTALNPDNRALLTSLVNTFNTKLQKTIADQASNVLLIDANSNGKQILASPAQYGVSNSTVPVCDLSKLPGQSALYCNQSTLIAGADGRYLFADDVHPSSYGHKLFADYVILQLAKKGWI